MAASARPNFGIKARIPVRPLSIENKDLAINKELIVDYTNGSIYIKTVDGDIINPLLSHDTIQELIEYIKNNPNIVIEATITNDEGNELTIEEAFNEIYSKIKNHDHDDYLKTSGGEMTGTITMQNNKNIYGKDTSGNVLPIAYIGADNMLHISSNGVPVIVDGVLILSPENYGTNSPPSNAVEGQVYLKIIEE